MEAIRIHGREGAQDEYTLVVPSELAPKPRTLDAVQAAAVPLSALTAWQALFLHAQVAPGQRVLIHGAAGAAHCRSGVSAGAGASGLRGRPIRTSSRQDRAHDQLGVACARHQSNVMRS